MPSDVDDHLRRCAVEPGRYRHYKGNVYWVTGCARHSETLESLVVYQNYYDALDMWVRPAEMFLGTVEVNGEQVPRFTFLGAD